ncbi:hypothetical protein ACFFK0_00355 [Paenibacillus chartarius]|uniref:Uncharacterized protein n=1 Tax=Paenibacillus chartarius TaxID=747481 RepID=A0ABV6DE42_9BACL
MVNEQQDVIMNGLRYTKRPANVKDAGELSGVLLQIDGETGHMDKV